MMSADLVFPVSVFNSLTELEKGNSLNLVVVPLMLVLALYDYASFARAVAVHFSPLLFDYVPISSVYLVVVYFCWLCLVSLLVF